MLGARGGIGGRGAKALPEDADHDVGIADLHPFVDQALRTLEVTTRSRVRLPTPYRPDSRHPLSAATRRLSSSITDNHGVALGRNVTWRDHHDPHDLSGSIRHTRSVTAAPSNKREPTAGLGRVGGRRPRRTYDPPRLASTCAPRRSSHRSRMRPVSGRLPAAGSPWRKYEFRIERD